MLNAALLGLIASCATSGSRTTVDTLVAQSVAETKPLTASPEKTLIGTWLEANGDVLVLKANKNADVITNGRYIKTPGGGNNIPDGMVMEDGVLARGKMVWHYQGNKEGGNVFLTLDNFDSNLGHRMNFGARFINDKKAIFLYQGDAMVCQKIK